MSENIPVKQIDPNEEIATEAVELQEYNLYAKREKIYTRAIKGVYQQLRAYTGWLLMIAYFGTSWLSWDDRQAVLFDLPTQKFYIFGLTFWPQDFVLLSSLLIICAFGLFTITVLFGRVWCGYTCPQTAWTFAFMWVEELTEGSRNARMKLDNAPWSLEKFLRKTAKHVLWLGFAGLTAIAFVGYFTPIKELTLNVVTLDWGLIGGWSLFWLAFFTLATYGNAGWLREQVCIYMCPYGRFQGVMFDPDTLIVSYDVKRGESRGSRKRGIDHKEQDLGDCIDCGMCVQVCPTGIDIREGLQYECITCALCIDACDSVMDKMNYDKGLIRYTTEHELQGQKTNIYRPRMIAYMLMLFTMIGLFAYTITTRVPLELDVLRDRTDLFRHNSMGLVENVYTLQVSNKSQIDRIFKISFSGLDQATLTGENKVSVQAGESLTHPISLAIDPARLELPNQKIIFQVVATDDDAVVSEEESRFIGPSRRAPY